MFRSPALPLLMGAISGGALALMLRYQNRMVFLIVLALWLLVLILAHWCVARFLGVRSERMLFLVTALSLSGIVSLVEWDPLRRGLVFFGTGLFALLFAALAAQSDGAIHIAQKPIRRFFTLVWVFDAYALATTVFAISVFFQAVPFALLACAMAAVLGYIAFQIWSLYFEFPTKFGCLLWGTMLGLMAFELLWVVHLLPFGYLAAGLLVTWIWYLLQLFIRFHLSSAGVIWRKQARFLVGNAMLFSAVLIFLVRWV